MLRGGTVLSVMMGKALLSLRNRGACFHGCFRVPCLEEVITVRGDTAKNILIFHKQTLITES